MTHDILEVRHGAIEHMQRLDDIDLHVERRQLLRTARAVRDARLRHDPGTQAHHLDSWTRSWRAVGCWNLPSSHGLYRPIRLA